MDSRKLGFGLVWLGLVAYAVFLAPPDSPNTVALIQKLITGQWEGINPLVVSLFNLMGIWPAVYTCLLLIDGRGQKIRAWPFALLSLFVGAFAILPYLALREPNPTFTGQKSFNLKLLDSRLMGIVLTVSALVMLYYGLRYGNLADFIYQWRTNRFIHVMSLDFCMLALLFPWLLSDDMERRGLTDERIFSAVSASPLLGPLVYLCFRPPLKETDAVEVGSN